jgi:hypothetical protein
LSLIAVSSVERTGLGRVLDALYEGRPISTTRQDVGVDRPDARSLLVAAGAAAAVLAAAGGAFTDPHQQGES